ncbi:DotD/TraH family lipoprotein [Proteus mirabilis]|uniref:DotD/TraH family lipoprotein n=1 Tax=Proteus mirabilis TaxID=584 RepID=UPI001A27239A|nr:DotD/TraH family lipoprotein [Proteus mirabilis]HEM8286035.1 DotD/TraH family lipoprotein [Providencia stuartii]EKU3803951.1 DotD/TraH family lipoprotein [Proteus mirabilis]EKV7963194.1 DotD/TraH family lipoprotein [Proteus mirabilis]ELB1171923.1 DotD/TraH family lipoprotein [Proteus mirabilis]ELB2631282.1 DotD/TraH family lipoprotein [Proteus mirabilis]
MLFKKNILILSILIISGCVTHKESTQVDANKFVYDELTKQAISIKLAQNELYQAGAINRTNFKIPTVINKDSQKLTINWNGDARELLSQLAKQSNKKFSTSGISLPLPVSINVTGASYYSLINLIQSQIGYRGVIESNVNEVILNYKGDSKRETKAIWK